MCPMNLKCSLNVVRWQFLPIRQQIEAAGASTLQKNTVFFHVALMRADTRSLTRIILKKSNK